MKTKYILLAVLIQLYATTAKACGICGAMMPGYVLASDKSTWLSLGYRYDHFGYLNPTGIHNALQVQHADFQWKYTWRQRYEFQTVLPYQMVNLVSENYTINHYSGLCDLSLIARRVFLRRDNKIVKRLAVGGGAELPVGNYRRSEYEPLMQPGSGTFDWILSANAGMRNRIQGINTQLQIKWNGLSDNLEHRANTIDFAAEYFREKWLGKEFFIQPKLNLFSQLSGRSSINYITDPQFSNQYFMGAGAGINMGMKKWFMGFNARRTLISNRQKSDLGYNFGCNLSLYYIL